METVIATDRQSVLDIISQVYGKVWVLDKFIDDNITGDFDLTAQVIPGSAFNYDSESDEADKQILRQIENKIFRTYPISNENENAEFNLDYNLDFTA